MSTTEQTAITEQTLGATALIHDGSQRRPSPQLSDTLVDELKILDVDQGNLEWATPLFHHRQNFAFAITMENA